MSRVTGPAGAAANDSSFAASISDDGRYVAFASYANNLSADDNDTYANVFVRDLQANTTTLASRATGAAGPGPTTTPSCPTSLGDGRSVAFYSNANNLSTEDDNTFANVFVRDLQANTTTLASRATGAGGAGASDGSYAAICRRAGATRPSSPPRTT